MEGPKGRKREDNPQKNEEGKLPRAEDGRERRRKRRAVDAATCHDLGNLTILFLALNSLFFAGLSLRRPHKKRKKKLSLRRQSSFLIGGSGLLANLRWVSFLASSPVATCWLDWPVVPRKNKAARAGNSIVLGLFLKMDMPKTSDAPYQLHYPAYDSKTDAAGEKRTVEVDVVIRADGANSRVANSISARDYEYAIAFQERIRIPDAKMTYYENLAEPE
ncbi:uncharacterized protein [Spinacia oleracea]|uniref:FAD-binding domain-containing protein n=1 Tax=Spinacia oleracea TaxID=3562 RepID=A0ABM3QQ70_SPIOL|nr:uncharacterized protein LOC130461426 [Spinacia oleracea]